MNMPQGVDVLIFVLFVLVVLILLAGALAWAVRSVLRLRSPRSEETPPEVAGTSAVRGEGPPPEPPGSPPPHRAPDAR